jgi:hypothetical protein
MKSSNLWARACAFAASALLVAGVAVAQTGASTGNIYGHATDQSGAALPGVTVTLSGGGAPQIQVTNAQGDFRFLGLAPGPYQVKAELEGFSTVDYPNVVVNLGRNTSIEMKLQSAVEETITVTAESPALDQRKITTGATVTKTELEKIPTARDPWVIMQTTPGVLIDRVNVGGNESGQQSVYIGHGDSTNSTWSVDGVEITDAAALGSSPSYFDFDAFEEMQVTTGGSDATQRTAGVGMNLVTKRGTNEYRGSGRYLTDDHSMESNSSIDSGTFGKSGAWNQNHAQPTFRGGNHVNRIEDYGAEAGGPVLKDHLWLWGSYGWQRVKLLQFKSTAAADLHDNTLLDTWNGKLNWQVISSNSATLFYSNNDKIKFGRNASPTRPQETTWDQGADRADPKVFTFLNKRPTAFKAEDTQIFGSSFYLTGMYAESDGGFFLHPEGGTANGRAALDPSSVWHNTYISIDGQRPEDQWRFDGSYFMNTGSLSHELKFGVGDRKATIRSTTTWPNGGIDVLDGAGNVVYQQLYAGSTQGNWTAEYESAYLQDTITAGNLTANVGVRYDIQKGSQLAATLNASPVVPNLFPGYTIPGKGTGFDEWKNFTPHLGVTYALGAEKQTLLRASYARYADQIGPTEILQTNLAAFPYVYVAGPNNQYYAPGTILSHTANWDPNHPGTLLLEGNQVEHGLTAPFSDEVNVSAERALLPEFVVGIQATYRKNKNLEQLVPLVFDGNSTTARRAVRSDFVNGNTYTVTLPDGSTNTVQAYNLRPGVTTAGGTILINGDKEQTYKGVALTFDKRLSNRWMLRGNFSYNDWTWDIPNSAIIDPTEPGNAAGFAAGGNRDGDQVVLCSGGSGSKGGVCLSSKWSYSINGLYQVMPDRPWGFDVSGSLNGHQGYAAPYTITGRRVYTSGTTSVNMLASDRPDQLRYDDLHIVNLRLAKEFRFSDFGLTLGVDVFNALNEATELQRQLKVSYSNATTPTGGDATRASDLPTNGDFVSEVVSPRIYRLGVQFSFR